MLFDFTSLSRSMREVIEPIVYRHAAEHLTGECSLCLSAVLMPSVSPDCSVASASGNKVTLAASSTLGFLYGIGRCLRLIASGESFSHTLRFVPSKKLRGVYFATHYNNWYVSAPEDELTRYIEDLALWGANNLAVSFDIHELESAVDIRAGELRRRLQLIFGICRRLGIRTTLGMVANESFSNSERELRADWHIRHSSCELPEHYHVEYCPSVPGGMNAILETKAEVLSLFRDCPPDMIWLWPYKQGGCTCSHCAPWGGNGYIKILKAFAPFVRMALPNCKVLASSWCFSRFSNESEWKAFLERTDEIVQCCDGLIAEFPDDLHFPEYLRDYPLPVYGFEDISRRESCPWGGYGANPMPRYLSEVNTRELFFQQGGYLCSEGIYDDLNKYIMLTLFCEPQRSTDDIMREYVRYEFGSGDDRFVEILQNLEETLPRSVQRNRKGCYRMVLKQPETVRYIAEQMDDLHADTAPNFRQNFRYRLIYLRTQIDRYLVENDFFPCQDLQQPFRQLTMMYHSQHAEWFLTPPTNEVLAQLSANSDHIRK